MKARNGKRRKTETAVRVDNGSPELTEGNSLQRVAATGELDLATNQDEAMAVARRMLVAASGVKDLDLASRIIDQVSRIQAVWPSGNASEALQVATELMLEFKPESLTESLLTVQMIGVHHAAVSCLQRMALQMKSSEELDAGARVSIRLMRLFMEQLEAMAKLRGKTGQQKVTVEHVHVHQGGQAIVGAVTATKREGEGGSE